jgi:hypothetical protein
LLLAAFRTREMSENGHHNISETTWGEGGEFKDAN